MKKILTLAFLVTSLRLVVAQDDLMKELEQSQKPEIEYASSTFKSSRLVNGQTVETKGKGELEFIFAHRFGAISSGSYNLFGLDQAYVRLGLEYGLTDFLGIGFGRNSVDKTMDGYVRYRLLRQSSGAKNIPVTITAFVNGAIRTSPEQLDPGLVYTDRLSYTGQLLIARKFSPKLSLQLMPTVIHRNAVNKLTEGNDLIALGAGGRFKVTRSIALTSEYYYRLDVKQGNQYKNSIGLGIDIETGGHVFQLVMTNAQGITERAFIGETSDNFFAGDIHLGFNVTRTFQLRKRK
jgi:hypothetical protein